VIFNQNHYYTFAAGDWGSEPYPGWVRRPAAIWVVSQESRAIMQRLCPGLDVRHIPTTIDADLFRPGPERVPGIAWIPRKRPREASLLARLLGGDSRTVDLELHEIVDRPLAEVADILGRITAFVSLGHNEGLGLTPAEALAAGCRVVGYDGGGGRELFEAPGAEAVAEARPLQLADRAVELATGSYDATLGRASRAWIAARYSPQRTTTALRDAVAAALTAPGKACVATHPARWFATIAPDFAVSG
jgi:hypothetical protein